MPQSRENISARSCSNLELQVSGTGSLIHDLFSSIARECPDQIALFSSDRTFTYDELYRSSSRWGRHLRNCDARPNTVVAVVMEKGWEQIVAVHGVLQAGAAYLPVDPDLPNERIHFLLENSGVSIVLTQSRCDGRLTWPAGLTRFCVDLEDLSEINDDPLEPVNTPEDLAFVIYTSGSTGSPKGVMIHHRGVVNAIECTNQTFEISPEDRVLAITALHHDMSVYDAFGILAAGGAIVMPDASGRKDPAHWSRLMKQNGVTLWNSVPAMMEMLLEYAAGRERTIPDSLRLAFLGGDWISVTLPKRLKEQADRSKVISVGGPTETTLWNIWYPVNDVDREWKSIPYGTPIRHTKYFVMNEALEECPAEIPGELCCAGIGLANGYLNDPEMTNAKFTRHPKTGERIYRTGDMGRYLADGNIEFLGRTDSQVKINGQRIELGEIEATLQQHNQVRAAVVLVTDGPGSVRRLAAYIVPVSCQAVVDVQLREYLLKKLPEHMVPSLFFMLDHLPLTANGKVDRRALPNPSGTRPELTTPYSEPTTSMERHLAEIWQELLHLNRVGIADNLFDLGAQSIHVVQAHSRLKSAVGDGFGIVALFQYPTIGSLAAYLTTANESISSGKVQARAERQRAAQVRQQLARGKVTNV